MIEITPYDQSPDNTDHPDYHYRLLLLVPETESPLDATILSVAASGSYDVERYTDEEEFEAAKERPFALAVIRVIAEGKDKITTYDARGDTLEMVWSMDLEAEEESEKPVA